MCVCVCVLGVGRGHGEGGRDENNETDILLIGQTCFVFDPLQRLFLAE